MIKALFDDWQLSDISSFIAGQPLEMTINTSPTLNITGGGDGYRALMVGNPNLSGGARTFYTWYNVAAFAQPTPISAAACTVSGCPPITVANIGNMSRTPIRGPGVSNWNMSLYKNFSIRERLRFQLRAEAYNTFNHTQYSGVDTTVTFCTTVTGCGTTPFGANSRASSGNITSARDPRIMQLALRIMF